jgi:hypothetical protein
MPIAPDIFGASIVAVGSFNPRLITPAWLRRNGLIGSDDEAAVADDPEYLVSRQITRFKAGIFHVQVLENQLSLSVTGPVSPALRDLAVGVLTILAHCPVTAIGLNFSAHFKIERLDDFHKIGDALAPKDIWRKMFKGDDIDVGMQDVTVVVFPVARNEVRTTQDAKRISVQPSGQIRQGVYFLFNDHYEVKPKENDKLLPAEIAASIVEAHWETTNTEAVNVFDSVLAQALGESV